MTQSSDFETQPQVHPVGKQAGPSLAEPAAGPSAVLRAAVSKAKADGVPNAVEKRTVPRIYYATRTHSQIAQVCMYMSAVLLTNSHALVAQSIGPLMGISHVV